MSIQNELEILHAGLGVLMARYITSHDQACIALWISRQLRLIAKRSASLDEGLSPIYLSMAARWHFRAVSENPEMEFLNDLNYAVMEYAPTPVTIIGDKL